MKFAEVMNDSFNNIRKIYDLAAFCYSYLMKVISNQNVFLGDYIQINEDAELTNPNSEMLNRFAMKVKKILEQNPYKAFSSSQQSNEIFDLVYNIENSLSDYEDPLMNQATIPFYILKGIDLYFKDRDYQTYKTAPLNNYCKEFCLIYVNIRSSLMDKIIIEKNYPDLIQPNEIRNYFKHLIILETDELPKSYGKPQLVTLHKNEEHLKKIVETKKIKIALIPAMRTRWFEFDVKQGSSFEVKYDKSQIESIKTRVAALLKWGIECKVNIIVFPEYICQEVIQTEIQNTLRQMSINDPKKLEELLFVAAGSGWTSVSNNVSCLYSYDGNLLGKVYKYSAYDNDINGKKYTERLLNPGKEITLVEIPGIGIFQTEICRNVSVNEFCLKLAKAFNTSFLLIAAWSPSVNIGFKKQIDAIVSSNHRACAAMANCCAVFSDLEEFRDEIGIVSAPQKKGSVIEASYQYVKRNKQECGCCESGCIFKICYDFNGTGQKDINLKTDMRILNSDNLLQIL